MVRKKKQNNFFSNWRLGVLQLAVVLMALTLLWRLFDLQVLQHDYYAVLASNQHQFLSVLTPERGQIFVQDKEADSVNFTNSGLSPAAVNRKAENLVISPYDIEDENAAAEKISAVTGVEIKELLNALADKSRRYWLVKKDLSEEEISAVKDLKIKGVWLETETKRHYPEDDFLSHTLGFLGFVGDDKRGVYGLERQFEDLLSGSEGRLVSPANASGQSIAGSSRKLVPAEHGANLVLTVDRAIQSEAERVLKDYTQRFGADGGSVIVMDPKTGNILAMANQPSFNPNEFRDVENVKVFNNPAVQSRYEPGSVAKPLVMAAALESGAVTPNDTYEDTGSSVFGSHTIKNSDLKAHGIQTMTQVLEKSLNTGMVYIQRKMGKETMKNFFKLLKLDEKTEITLPGEITGDLRNLDSNSDIQYATASFGQGISVTPIGLVRAYTAIANKGEMVRPNIISEIRYADGTKQVVQSEKAGKVFSEKTAAQVSSMLVNVVENGHGHRAKVEGYYIAGKTGTAQVPLENQRGYDPDKTIGSFIGFGPVEDPKFLMLVKIDNPKGVRFAESTAAPAFGEIAKFILDYLQVPPTRFEQ